MIRSSTLFDTVSHKGPFLEMKINPADAKKNQYNCIIDNRSGGDTEI